MGGADDRDRGWEPGCLLCRLRVAGLAAQIFVGIQSVNSTRVSPDLVLRAFRLLAVILRNVLTIQYISNLSFQISRGGWFPIRLDKRVVLLLVTSMETFVPCVPEEISATVAIETII